MLEGIKRSKIVKDIRLPIALDLLNRIINQLPVICSSGYESTLFAAAISVAYNGSFRVGEIAFTKPGQFHQILGLQDVNIIRKGAQYFINVHLLYSKPDQSGKGADICLYKNRFNCLFCISSRKIFIIKTKLSGSLILPF